MDINAIEAQIEWRQEQPYSTQFEDVYFSSDDGLLETDYVFLQGNQLNKRWQDVDLNKFNIIETGFGTGLNFLCAVDLWLKIAPSTATLFYTSIEKYPLSLPDITKACQFWPSLLMIQEPLLMEYSRLLSTSSISMFNNKVNLTLLKGDVSYCINLIDNKADAWFLDGFSPAKNPDMWLDSLFKSMAKLSNQQTTFATFTSAGVVRRGLTEAGFNVNKQSGFGKKREMLLGNYVGNDHS